VLATQRSALCASSYKTKQAKHEAAKTGSRPFPTWPLVSNGAGCLAGYDDAAARCRTIRRMNTSSSTASTEMSPSSHAFQRVESSPEISSRYF